MGITISARSRITGKAIYDPRIGRFLSVDPLSKSYPELTPYQFGSDNPVENIDLDGLEGVPSIRQPNGDVSAAQSSTYVHPVKPRVKVVPAQAVKEEQTIAMADIHGNGWIGPRSTVVANVAAVKQEYINAVGDNIRGGLFGAVGYLAAGDKGSFAGAAVDGVAMSIGGHDVPGVFPTQTNRVADFDFEPQQQNPIVEQEPILPNFLNIKTRPAGMQPMEWGNQLHYDQLNGGTGIGLPTQLALKYPQTDFVFTPRGAKGADVQVIGGQDPWTYPGSTWKAGNKFGDFKTIKDTKFNSEINSGKLPRDTQKLTYDPSTGKLQ
jgi:hypothetical protein